MVVTTLSNTRPSIATPDVESVLPFWSVSVLVSATHAVSVPVTLPVAAPVDTSMTSEPVRVAGEQAPALVSVTVMSNCCAPAGVAPVNVPVTTTPGSVADVAVNRLPACTNANVNGVRVLEPGTFWRRVPDHSPERFPADSRPGPPDSVQPLEVSIPDTA